VSSQGDVAIYCNLPKRLYNAMSCAEAVVPPLFTILTVGMLSVAIFTVAPINES
jgi:hypothetical protein